jgi:hypothetical protein
MANFMRIEYSRQPSSFGGNHVISRYFKKIETRQYIWLEAHESGAAPGLFHCAIWTNEGNMGGPGGITTDKVLEWMMDFVTPEGFVATDNIDDVYGEETHDEDGSAD